MNKFILDELNKCSTAIVNFSECDTIIHIPKGIRDSNKLEFSVGNYYSIQLKDYLIHPSDNFIFHIQWNNGNIPKDSIMNVQILEIMGKMIKVYGSGESNTVWQGWLPIDSVDILNILY